MSWKLLRKLIDSVLVGIRAFFPFGFWVCRPALRRFIKFYDWRVPVMRQWIGRYSKVIDCWSEYRILFFLVGFSRDFVLHMISFELLSISNVLKYWFHGSNLGCLYISHSSMTNVKSFWWRTCYIWVKYKKIHLAKYIPFWAGGRLLSLSKQSTVL